MFEMYFTNKYAPYKRITIFDVNRIYFFSHFYRKNINRIMKFNAIDVRTFCMVNKFCEN